MWEFLYELFFSPEYDYYPVFAESGYITGGIILLLLTITFITFYYILIGNQPFGEPYARPWIWLIVLVINSFLVCFITLYWVSFKVFEIVDGWDAIPDDIWVFSFINSVFAAVLFLVFSIAIKRYTVHTYKIPF